MLKLPPGHFDFLMPLSQQAKKGIMMFTGVVDPDNQMEIELLLHDGGKEKHVWNRDLLDISVLRCPIIKVNGKVQQPNPRKTTNGPDFSGKKFGTTPRKDDHLRYLFKTKGI